mmetsp:Transcript_48052/g.127236  ORF Transcript_48052/g.127236 Transcript_48052/m.127236 type:complete len:86 (+) Transcript_48052:129-386(+)
MRSGDQQPSDQARWNQSRSFLAQLRPTTSARQSGHLPNLSAHCTQKPACLQGRRPTHCGLSKQITQHAPYTVAVSSVMGRFATED